jgi:ribosomal-protein-alanine N-acetyltransferase
MIPELDEIRTSRLRLWSAGPDAAFRLLRYHEDNWAHLRRWSPPVPDDFLTLGYWERRLVGERAAAEAGRAARWAISWADDDLVRVIGTVGLSEIARGPVESATVGYGLAEREQGKGVMTEALTAVARHAFGPLGLHQLFAGYLPTNEPSGKVLRRVGFQVVGYFRDHIYINGAWRDHIMTALIEPRSRPPGA